MNLLLNAADAVRERGRIEVHLTHRDGSVQLLEDRGRGIPVELQDRAFDPFFTTKVVGEGTGLDLSVSRQIVTSHDASLTLTSSPDVAGARFTVNRPAC